MKLRSFIIGLFLFAIVVPLVSLEYYAGKLAAVKGFKKLFGVGYFVICICLFLAYIVSNVYLTLLFLVLGSLGAALIETNREAYFLSKAKKKVEREKFYGVYMTHYDVFGLLGKGVASFLLLFFSLKFVYLLLAVEILLFALVSRRTK